MNTKKKKQNKLLLLLLLICVIAVAGISAYFTATDTKTNVFEVGKVSIDLQEPSWNGEIPTTPNQTVPKDPQILNDGKSDAYVYLTVDVPYANVVTAGLDGTKNTQADNELFNYTVNEGWVEVGTAEKVESESVYRHVYAYASNSATLSVLNPNATTAALFNEIKFANVVEAQGLELTDLDVVVNAYGIQTEIVGDNITPDYVWKVIVNQAVVINEVSVDFSQFSNGYVYCENNNVKFADTGSSYAIIPVKAGETYRIDGQHAWNSNCYILADENQKVTRFDSGKSGVQTIIRETFTVEKGESYLYINEFGFTSLEKIDNFSASSFPLMDKKIIYDGDSIATSAISAEWNGGGYSKMIADSTLGNYVNQAVGGATLTTGNDASHSIVDNLVNLPTDGDLYCFQAGINDFWGNVEIGTYSETDFTGELDTTTISGALEYIFRYCKENFPDKPICFVITHKVQETAYKENSVGNTFEDYHDVMVAICEKYGVAYYDAFLNSGLDGSNESQLNIYFKTDEDGNGDGCHPNVAGYKKFYVPQLISLFKEQFK